MPDEEDIVRSRSGHIVALSGGVGGAKLALGLRNILPHDRLVVIANTADDFEPFGLHVSPDIDTLLYTLGGLSDPVRGWGRKDESWNFMRAMQALGGETWFQLGDADLATHVERTRRLRTGESLTQITQDFARRLDVRAQILPMCDAPVRTRLMTDAGGLDFQDYFVRLQCQPKVSAIEFSGAEQATISPQLDKLLRGPIDAVIICPSNPFISVEPILSVPHLKARLRATGAPIVAVSPLIGGEAVKGPTARMFRELGIGSTTRGVAERYRGFADVLVVDEGDRAGAESLPLQAEFTSTLMVTSEDRERLAQFVLDACARSRR